MRTKFYLLMLIAFITSNLFAQSYTLKGVVSDDEGMPLPGVSVVVKGTKTGTTTDFDGAYTLNVEKGSTLVFSFVGFDDKEIKTDGTSTLNVKMQSGVNLDEVVLLGSRNQARTAIDSAVPVDVFNAKELTSSVPQTNLNQMLNFVAPSFSSNTQTISDGTDHIDPASLRGLGPDQVLVLINGKRRHNTSLININGTFGRGNVGTDLNAIPAAAIDRIEVLRDGAAAQYGSDAIAGVINIVLKKDVNTLDMSVTSGAYFSQNSNEQTGGMDGATTNIAASYGIGLGEKGGYLTFAGDFDVRDDYSRMKMLENEPIFNRLNAVEWQASKMGYDTSKLYDTDYSDINTYAQMVPYLDATTKAAITTAATTNNLTDLRTLLKVDASAAEMALRGLDRTDFNMRVGQSALRGSRLFLNMSLPLDDNGTELYAFSGLSSRTGNSAGFYRLPNQNRTYSPMYINGFLPEINSNIGDQSMAVGIKGNLGDWKVDFSNTYGKNKFLYVISNTSNASMLGSSPNRFDAGGYSFAQNTTNLDLTKMYEDVFEGLNVAFGAENRMEKYDIYAGELGSYAQFDIYGNPITNPSQTTRKDFFGATRPGGSQVFPGFSPANELSRGRNSVAGYVDLEADFTEKWLLSVATRFENYSDFGSTINYKLATRYKLGDVATLRFAANTGFRAPSLHQIYFNSTSTIFNNFGIPVEVGTFSNDSKVAQLLGIPELKQETSKSISAGFTAKMPAANLTFTADAYLVSIADRIVYTGSFTPKADAGSSPPTYSGAQLELYNLLSLANASAAAFFANAIDTESKGVDFVITHKAKMGNANLKTDLAGTLSQTRRVGDIKASDVLRNAGLVTTYFSEESRVYLEEAVPSTKINLTNTLQVNKFNLFLRNVYFGEVTEATTDLLMQQDFSKKLVTDLSLGYNMSKSATLTVGANNLFDIYPDRAAQDLKPDVAGDQNNRSNGRFDWSRRAQQFGIGGRFMFARLTFEIK